jgi:hypothetical protein
MQVDEETLFFSLLDYSVLVDPTADPVVGACSPAYINNEVRNSSATYGEGS